MTPPWPPQCHTGRWRATWPGRGDAAEVRAAIDTGEVVLVEATVLPQSQLLQRPARSRWPERSTAAETGAAPGGGGGGARSAWLRWSVYEAAVEVETGVATEAEQGQPKRP